MDLLFAVGTRPNLIKVKPLTEAADRQGLSYSLYDTCQHYDDNMRSVFYRELDLPPSGGWETAKIVVVIGDTNSTVECTKHAIERGLPVAHVEAGCRCGEPIPEELNRIFVDSVATWNFCVTETQAANCANAFVVGDVLHDSFTKHGLPWRADGNFAVATIHRQENTKDFSDVLDLLRGPAEKHPLVLMPVHPRINGIPVPANVFATAPISYKQMLRLISCAQHVYTDSGGLQREAFWTGVPCTVLRKTTEWTKIPIGDGHASDRIMEVLKRSI